jgi:hypothetical protein
LFGIWLKDEKPTTSPSPVGSGTPPSEKEEILYLINIDRESPLLLEGGVPNGRGGRSLKAES